jgi:selenium metabolism protein YedF
MKIKSGYIILVTGESLGRGDEDLGRLLMQRLLHEVGGQRSLPEKVMFLNSGVNLVVEGSPALDQVRHLEDAGVEIVACGTCLERFGLLDRLAVGNKTDMGTTVGTLLEAAKVVSI